MDPATLIGFVISLGALLTFMILEGSDPMSLLFLPAIVLVIFATFGAAASSHTLDDLKKIPGLVQDGRAAGQGARADRADPDPGGSRREGAQGGSARARGAGEGDR